MINKNNFELKYFEGLWISQNNIYLMKNKTQRNWSKNLSFIYIQNTISKRALDNNIQQMVLDIYINSIKDISLISKRVNVKKKINLHIKKINRNLLQINYESINKTFTYEEYIYTINKNLVFSTGILKNKRHNKYLANTISSYIKRKN
uniref:Uncharacterized protein n=1 Tax=Chondria sp. (in: red algae) TaxID=1982705 RepID=A0A1Z1ME59_9FLOR|nr:hypothetical protein [Chondria sp. (in: red algae)]